MSDEDIKAYRKGLEAVCRRAGFYLNPENSFTDELIKGIIINNRRYGYESCPCRLAKNDRQKDIDIICPCYYKDDDVSEYGSCYCGLYVSKEIFEKKLAVNSIPERRNKPAAAPAAGSSLSTNVWRCNVCGYLCAKDNPPDVCPICKAPKERFEIFIKKDNG